jgi:hypothetical protein
MSILSVAVAGVLSAAPALAQFETRISYRVLDEPYSIAVGDFNHDGKLDMAVASISTATQVSVLLGNGDGTFKPAVNYDSGYLPNSVVSADFNGDGNLDLAVADSGSSSNNVAILLGNGDGTFQAPKFYSTPSAPTFVTVGDFNNDHKLDLVLTDGQYVSVMLGNGDGTFQPPINTSPAHAPVSLGVGQFNADGKLDVVVAQEDLVDQVQVLLGNGDGTFRLGATYPVGPIPDSIAVADFRGIGKQDVAVACTGGLGVEVLLGNGDGTFQQEVTYDVPSAEWVVAVDLNGDGKLDLAVADFSLTQHHPTGAASTLLGNGDGTFQAAHTYLLGKTNSFIAVDDFNGDKKPDLAVADRQSGDVIILLSTGGVDFSPTSPVDVRSQLIGTTSAPQAVTLTNTGTTALAISSMKVARQFGMASTCGASVAPGANCSISTTFSPQGKGPKSGSITIQDSASTRPQVIELMGAGTVVELAPESLAFGSQKVGAKSAPRTIQLTNIGAASLSIGRLLTVGTEYRDFPQSNTCGTGIAAGASCTITVAFDPAKTGKRTASIYIADDGGGSPQIVLLTGTGD